MSIDDRRRDDAIIDEVTPVAKSRIRYHACAASADELLLIAFEFDELLTESRSLAKHAAARHMTFPPAGKGKLSRKARREFYLIGESAGLPKLPDVMSRAAAMQARNNEVRAMLAGKLIDKSTEHTLGSPGME